MPNYDFRCNLCDYTEEYFLAIKDKDSDVICKKCQSKMVRILSSCNFTIHSGNQSKKLDEFKRESAMKTELREDYGIHNFSPLQANKTTKDIYNEVKQQGSFVKDQFALEAKRTAEKNKPKQKEWAEGALKRLPTRRKEMAEKKAKEAALKRKINL